MTPDPNRAPIPEPVAGPTHAPSRKYRMVATHADPEHGLTPAYYAVQRWGLARAIVALPSFGDAAHALRQGIVPAMVVPAGEPTAAAVLAEDGFALRAMEFFPTPGRVLAGPRPAEGERAVVVCPPHETGLLAGLPFEVAAVVGAPDALEAARLAHRQRGVLAITDYPSAERFRLEVLRGFGHGPEEAFCCIARSDDPVVPPHPRSLGIPAETPFAGAGLPVLGRQRCGLN